MLSQVGYSFQLHLFEVSPGFDSRPSALVRPSHGAATGSATQAVRVTVLALAVPL